jgi:hypothetical protein
MAELTPYKRPEGLTVSGPAGEYGYYNVMKPVIGEKYHLCWAKRGCVWRLISFDEDGIHCNLKTPKTGMYFRGKVADLRHIRKNEQNPH